MSRSVTVTGSTTSSPTARRSVGVRPTGQSPARTTTTRAGFAKGSAEGTGGPSRPTGHGFGKFKSVVKSTSGGEFNDFEVEEGKRYLIAFMEDGPFDVIAVHWVPTFSDEGRPYNTPRNCPKSRDDEAECPLCDVELERKPVAYFNVVDLDEPAKVALWKATKDPASQVEKLWQELQELASGPLELNSEGVYAVVYKARKGGKKNAPFVYTVTRVKERDLAEDHGKKPIPNEAFEALESRLYTSEKVIKYSDLDELRDLAATAED
jgi:hypothetical protein